MPREQERIMVDINGLAGAQFRKRRPSKADKLAFMAAQDAQAARRGDIRARVVAIYRAILVLRLRRPGIYSAIRHHRL